MPVATAILGKDQVYIMDRGAFATLTSSPGETATDATFVNRPISSNQLAWYKGRLYSTRMSGTGNSIALVVWDSVANTWSVCGTTSSYTKNTDVCRQALVVLNDKLYMIWSTQGSTTTSATLAWWFWEWDGSTLTKRETIPYILSQSLTKTSAHSFHYINEALDFQGAIFFCNWVGVNTLGGSAGSIRAIEEYLTGTWPTADHSCRSLNVYKKPTESVACLYVLDANGKVKKISGGAASLVKDLKAVNHDIRPRTSTTDAGAKPLLIPANNRLYAFLNDSSGVVVYRSQDLVTWENVTTSLIPTELRPNNGSWFHMHGIQDPDTGEVRVAIINNTSYEGGEYTLPASGALSVLGYMSPSTAMSYIFFDKDAVDPEVLSPPVVNHALGTATMAYTLYRQAAASGITVVPEYSADGGYTWSTATRKTGQGDATTGRTANDSGVAATFVWDYNTDLGAGSHSNIRFRIRTQQ